MNNVDPIVLFVHFLQISSIMMLVENIGAVRKASRSAHSADVIDILMAQIILQVAICLTSLSVSTLLIVGAAKVKKDKLCIVTNIQKLLCWKILLIE